MKKKGRKRRSTVERQIWNTLTAITHPHEFSRNSRSNDCTGTSMFGESHGIQPNKQFYIVSTLSDFLFIFINYNLTAFC